MPDQPQSDSASRRVHDAFVLYWDDGVLVQKVPRYAEFDVAAAKATLRYVRELAGSRRPAMLVDMREPASVAAEARAVFAEPELSELVASVALLAASSVTTLAANLFLRINRPPVPTRVFRDEAEARSWLAEHA